MTYGVSTEGWERGKQREKGSRNRGYRGSLGMPGVSVAEASIAGITHLAEGTT